MKNIILAFAAITLSGASASGWEKLGDANLYLSTTGEGDARADRVAQFSNATVSDDAAILGVYYPNLSVGDAYIECTKIVYQGELENTFVFQISKKTEIVSKDDPLDKYRYNLITNPQSKTDRASGILIVCGFSLKTQYGENLTFYVPNRFSNLALPKIYADMLVKLTRLEGTAIRFEVCD